MYNQNQNSQMPNPDPQPSDPAQQPPIAGQQPLNQNQQLSNLNPQPPIPSSQPPVYPSPSYTAYQSYSSNPSNPSIPCPWATFNQLLSYAIDAEHRLTRSEIENARHRDRDARRELKEDAYSSTNSSSGYTTTHDGLGRMVELLNAEIKWAAHLIFNPPYRRQNFYIIQFTGRDLWLTLSEEQFSKDTQLVQAFSELPGVHVRLCRTTKLTATLLRQAVSAKIEVISPPFWGGWQQDKAHQFGFLVFANGHTSADTNRKASLPVPIEHMLEATMVTAVQRFAKATKPHSASSKQWLLLLAFHTAVLTTLLKQLGYPFPLALCVLTESTTVRTGLQTLFRWHGDSPLSLAFPPPLFADGLLNHKDEVLLIMDDCGSGFARANSELLGQVLTSRQVPWKNKRDLRYFPLQALPVILSSTASALTVHPDCLTVEVPSDLVCSVPDASAFEASRQDYLAAFVQYTTEHIDDLRRLLEDGRKQAFTLGGEGLTENCVSALGILLALDNFVRNFHRHCDLTVPPLNERFPDALDWLRDLFQQTSDKLLDYGNLAAQFIVLTRKLLANGTLCPCPTEYESMPTGDLVYFDRTYLGFTRSAMSTISRSLGQSRPSVLHALSEAGLLLGKPVNSGTFLTRISTWSVYGQHKTERVYLFARDLFNELGNPLSFGGEEN